MNLQTFASPNLANHDTAGAASYAYMNLFGLIALGYMRCRIIDGARQKLVDPTEASTQLLSAKLITGRFFVEQILPDTGALLARIESGSASTMELPTEVF